MEKISAMERLKGEFITEIELAEFLNVDTKRIRDLRSHHVTGKQSFVDHIKPTGKCILYRYKDVLNWLNNHNNYSFGINKECQDSE